MHALSVYFLPRDVLLWSVAQHGVSYWGPAFGHEGRENLFLRCVGYRLNLNEQVRVG